MSAFAPRNDLSRSERRHTSLTTQLSGTGGMTFRPTYAKETCMAITSTLRRVAKRAPCAAAILLMTIAASGAAEKKGPPEQTQLLPIVVGQPQRLEVYPPSVKLSTSRSRINLIVTAFYADGRTQDVTRVAIYASGNDKVTKLTAAQIAPVADGKTE